MRSYLPPRYIERGGEGEGERGGRGGEREEGRGRGVKGNREEKKEGGADEGEVEEREKPLTIDQVHFGSKAITWKLQGEVLELMKTCC